MTTHLYSPLTPRGAVTVYRGPFEGHVSSRKFNATGTIELRWRPTPTLYWFAESSEPDIAFDPATGHFVLDKVHVTVPAANPFEVAPPTTSRSAGTRWSERGPQARTMVGDATATNLTHATFLVANMPALAFGSVLRSGDTRYTGRNVLTGAGWAVTLDAPPESSEIEKDLRENGGHAITHVGRVERDDGNEFRVEDLSSVLSALRYTLSLACGRWVSPMLPVAYRTADPAWAEWATPSVEPWRTSFALVDPQHPEQLDELFGSVATIWSDPLKQEVVGRAIYYLIDANDPHPLEIGLTSAQAGLELMAWTELVEDRGIHSPRSFKDLKAQDSMRELLTLHSIDPSLPTALLPALPSIAAKLAGNPPADDGPAILTRMRNGTMHPTRSKPKFDIDEWYDAWCLARNYLQLAILAYIGYRGSHRDPAVKVHWAGQAEPVPWNPTP